MTILAAPAGNVSAPPRILPRRLALIEESWSAKEATP